MAASIPRYPGSPTTTDPPSFPDRTWFTTLRASSEGMANPTLESDWNASLREPAVIIPTTCPAVLIRGPPESPGWMSASVRIMSRSRSTPPWSSPTEIDWPTAVTLPLVTAGAPPRPSALPMATTCCPIDTVEESANVTVGRPRTPSTCRSATSEEGSVPTTRAAYVPERPWNATSMRDAPWTTWLFVRISPDDVRTMPVPAASARGGPPDRNGFDGMTVRMSTTAGVTLAATAATLVPVPEAPLDGAAG